MPRGHDLADEPGPPHRLNLERTIVCIVTERQVDGLAGLREDGPNSAPLGILGERLAAMLEAALAHEEVSPEEARGLLQEMSSGLEEMRVAEEELTAQAEQLAASNLLVDAERERYVQLFEFAPDAYVETDSLGKIVEANTAAERLLGVSIRALAGKLLQSFVSHDDLRTVRLAIGRMRDGEGPTTFEVQVQPRDLPPVTVEMRAACHYDPTVAPRGEYRVRWLVRDISERLKLDQEIRELHADVEMLAALGQVNRLVSGRDPVEPMLEALLQLAIRPGAAAHAAVSIPGDHGGEAIHVVSGPVARELVDLSPSDDPGLACPEPGATGLDGQAAVPGSGPYVTHRADLSACRELVAAMARHHVDWIVSQRISLPDGAGAGVLRLYGAGSAEAGEHTIELLAAHASAIVTNGLLYRSATELSIHLGRALESRGVIEQAKGVLMAWQGCDADRAFDILRRVSQRENRKLRVVAEDIVERAVASSGREGRA
jgi:PAS domain S-box-containing protein